MSYQETFCVRMTVAEAMAICMQMQVADQVPRNGIGKTRAAKAILAALRERLPASLQAKLDDVDVDLRQRLDQVARRWLIVLADTAHPN